MINGIGYRINIIRARVMGSGCPILEIIGSVFQREEKQ